MKKKTQMLEMRTERLEKVEDDKPINLSTSTEKNESNLTMTKHGAVRNLLVISVSFVLLFSAFASFANLQSSINKEEGLGTTGQAVIYVLMVFSSLVLTPVTMSRVTEKWIIVVSMFTYLIFVATGFYSSWYTIMPASVIVGTAFVWGNLISFYVFQRDETNSTLAVDGELCGPNFCPHIVYNSTNIFQPPKQQIYIFTGACCGLNILAILLTVFFITDITGQKTSGRVWSLAQQVSLLLCTSRSQHLLLFPTLLGGLAEGFLYGDFTQAYVSCSYGVKNVGFAMVAYGIAQSVGSIIFGKLNQYLGHLAIYIFALYNLYFSKNKVVAISSFRLLYSAGTGLSYGYSNWLCSRYKLYILLTIVGLSCLSLIVQHIRYKRKQRDKQLK
ncbi:Protein unc-93 A [Mactra antiquata]